MAFYYIHHETQPSTFIKFWMFPSIQKRQPYSSDHSLQSPLLSAPTTSNHLSYDFAHFGHFTTEII